jgi:CheY-like chemotaxis protein
MRGNPTVLLVEADPVEGEMLRSWLEGSGHDVTVCAGPSPPTYVCIGDRSGSCPLVEESDVVVVDCRLEGDHVPEGTSAPDLLSLYLCSGRPVVALEAGHLSTLFHDEDVVFLNEDAEGGLLGAVDRALDHSGDPARAGPPLCRLSPG